MILIDRITHYRSQIESKRVDVTLLMEKAKDYNMDDLKAEFNSLISLTENLALELETTENNLTNIDSRLFNSQNSAYIYPTNPISA